MKFNKNEFGWKEKVSVNTDELVTKNDIPHYNETLMFEISGDDYRFFRNNNYFNMSALNIDETKTYIGKIKVDIEYTFKFVYNKEADALMDEVNQMYIYNHKSYNGTDFIEDENSAVITNMIATFGTGGGIGEVTPDGYFRLYKIDKVELDSNCLPNDVNVPNSLTVGNRIGDIGMYSVAEGIDTEASGESSHAEGEGTEASGESSHAEGEGTEATGNVSHAEGAYTIASGNISHAEGGSTTASGDFSHAEGDNTTASGENSHAEGGSSNLISDVISDFSPSTSNDDILTAWNNRQFSLAKGNASHVEGKDCLALGNYSHAEGSYTTASGTNSHAEGLATTANGGYSHAEGNGTTADNMCSHAEGDMTTASGDSSHAEGKGTIASSENQHVQGKYNIEDTTNTYAHIVGNGTYNYNTEEEVRSNAHTLDWQGNAWYKGELYTGGTSQSDANKVLTTANISFNESGELVVTIGNVTKIFVPKQ